MTCLSEHTRCLYHHGDTKPAQLVQINQMWYRRKKSKKIIRSLYENIKLRVKSLNSLSDLYTCDEGLLQGEILSPFLFSIFLSDIEMHLG